MVLLRRFSAAAAAVSCLAGLGGCAQPAPGASAPAAQVSAAAARSPMITEGAMVLAVVTRGMIEASAIRRFSMP